MGVGTTDPADADGCYGNHTNGVLDRQCLTWSRGEYRTNSHGWFGVHTRYPVFGRDGGFGSTQPRSPRAVRGQPEVVRRTVSARNVC